MLNCPGELGLGGASGCPGTNGKTSKSDNTGLGRFGEGRELGVGSGFRTWTK